MQDKGGLSGLGPLNFGNDEESKGKTGFDVVSFGKSMGKLSAMLREMQKTQVVYGFVAWIHLVYLMVHHSLDALACWNCYLKSDTLEAPDVSKTKQPPEGDSKGADPAACGLQTGSERVDSFAQRKMFFSVVRQTNLYWVQTGYIYIYLYNNNNDNNNDTDNNNNNNNSNNIIVNNNNHK
jgi:hypothetical protein